jgi:hypothetical protein
MRRIWDIGIRSGEYRRIPSSALAQRAGSQEDDRSLAAVMREIAWSLASWLGFVVAVQLLLHAFRIAWA